MTNIGGNHKPVPFNLLVTSIAAKTPLIRELKSALHRLIPDGRLIGADLSPNCPGRYFVDDFWPMPAPRDLDVAQLIRFCRDREIKVIIPTRDGELLYFASHREKLKIAGVNVMVSTPDAIRSCCDKLSFYQAISRLMPEVSIPTATEPETLACDRYVVKERHGAGSKSILLNATRQAALAWSKQLNEPIFQPQINGQEFSVDVYLGQNGKAKGALVRSRDLISGGEAQISTTVFDMPLEQLCCQLAEQLGLLGHVVFQGIREESDRFKLIECNCRFGGASTLSIAAGLDSFYWFMLEVLGEDLGHSPFNRAKQQLRQIRYAEDLILDISSDRKAVAE